MQCEKPETAQGQDRIEFVKRCSSVMRNVFNNLEFVTSMTSYELGGLLYTLRGLQLSAECNAVITDLVNNRAYPGGVPIGSQNRGAAGAAQPIAAEQPPPPPQPVDSDPTPQAFTLQDGQDSQALQILCAQGYVCQVGEGWMLTERSMQLVTAAAVCRNPLSVAKCRDIPLEDSTTWELVRRLEDQGLKFKEAYQ